MPHRPGSLKQQNKKHKTSKDSKRSALKQLGSGKTGGVKGGPVGKSVKLSNLKAERINRANQLRRQKREQIRNGIRSTAVGMRSSGAATKVVGILPLSDHSAIVDRCLQLCLNQMHIDTSSSNFYRSSPTVAHAYDPEGRCHYTFLHPAEGRDLLFALDVAKSADVLLMGVHYDSSCQDPLSGLIDADGVHMISALKAIGCPDVIFCVEGDSYRLHGGGTSITATDHDNDTVMQLDTASVVQSVSVTSSSLLHKRRVVSVSSVKTAVHDHIYRMAVLPESKVVDINTADDGTGAGNQLARTLRNLTPRPVSWLSSRSYFVADCKHVVCTTEQSIGDGDAQIDAVDGGGIGGIPSSRSTCTIQVGGYVRGRPMSVHSLMHIMGVGTGRIVRAWKGTPLVGPGARKEGGPRAGKGPMEDGTVVVVACKDKQDSLQLAAQGNNLAGEQTWPSAGEMTGLPLSEDPSLSLDRDQGRDRRVLPADMTIPSGMSSYQADWFMDEQGRVDFNAEEQEGGDSMLDADDQLTIGGDSLCGHSIHTTLTQRGGVGGSKSKAALKQLAMDHEVYPDEIDTPDDVSARTRFARYRALQSFRASHWNPKENLPCDYSSLYQFENFAGTQKRLLAEAKQAEHLQSQAMSQSRARMKAASTNASVVADLGNDHDDDDHLEAVEEDEDDKGMNIDDDGDDDNDGGGMDDGSMEHPRSISISGRISSSSSNRHTCPYENEDSLTVHNTEDYIKTGQYVIFEVEQLPLSAAAHLLSSPRGFFLCHSLYPHEHKLSVLHFHVSKHPSYSEVLKSKEELLFQVGFRSFLTRPIFSESNLNCDKHKFERFLQSDRFSVASCYGPICVSTCPVLVFKRRAVDDSCGVGCGGDDDTRMVRDSVRSSGSQWVLVATGSLMNIEPDRIILKKIILTGFPIRVRKKFAVVKHMFYDPQDIRWFKPVELVTKYGLRGHITEPLGTHGLFKAQFSAVITQNDTVMLVLYKRVYPKYPERGIELL